MKKEEWRPVVGYEGLYEVSNYGDVRNKRKKLLRPGHSGSGYYYVGLRKDGITYHVSVHRIVARAFQDICGRWFEGCVINHKDRNPSNNAAWNLEVCTQAYNVSYDDARVRRSKTHKERYSRPVAQFTKEGVFVRKWSCPVEAANGLSLCLTTLYRVLVKQKHYNTVKGFRFEYI